MITITIININHNQVVRNIWSNHHEYKLPIKESPWISLSLSLSLSLSHTHTHTHSLCGIVYQQLFQPCFQIKFLEYNWWCLNKNRFNSADQRPPTLGRWVFEGFNITLSIKTLFEEGCQELTKCHWSIQGWVMFIQ